MATFKPCIRSVRDDGFAQAYIRISHKSATDYIKTDYWVEAKKGIKDGEIVDRYVLTECLIIIKDYINKLNGVNIKGWTVQKVKQHLLMDSSGISFTDFSEIYIKREMLNKNDPSKRYSPGSAANYQTSVNSLKKFLKKDDLTFKDLSTKSIGKWIESLNGMKRAKSMYPQSIKTIFDAGLIEYNDYDNEIMLIKNNPFKANKVPSQDKSSPKRNIDRDLLKKILFSDVKGEKSIMARDVAFMSFCLAGINTVDLYLMKKENFRQKKLCHNRKKTMDERPDGAYFEITVPEMILPLFEKHKGEEALFNFPEKYYSAKEFNKAVNEGLKQISEQLGIEDTTSYTFRKTWSSMAQNDCGASTELVAFCLNHASAHRVTDGYIEKDFSPVDKMNKKVIDFVFNNKRRVSRK